MKGYIFKALYDRVLKREPGERFIVSLLRTIAHNLHTYTHTCDVVESGFEPLIRLSSPIRLELLRHCP